MKFQEYLNENTQKRILDAIDKVDGIIKTSTTNMKKIVDVIERELTKQGRKPQIRGQIVKIERLENDIKGRLDTLRTFAQRIEE